MRQPVDRTQVEAFMEAVGGRSGEDGAHRPSESTLGATLRALGVPLLTPALQVEAVTLPELLAAAVREGVPSRVRTCLVPLFLVRPDAADPVRILAARLPGGDAELLRHLYTAAVYLQRKWWTRLRFSVGERPALPDLFSHDLGLPAPDDYHGIWGLLALADLSSERGLPAALIAEAEDMTRLLIETRELELAA